MPNSTSSNVSRSNGAREELTYVSGHPMLGQTGQIDLRSGFSLLDAHEYEGSPETRSHATFDQKKLQLRIEKLLNHNEELQAVNEELLSANIGLQKANEELNSRIRELDHRNSEISRLINNYANLHDGDRIGAIIIDRQMQILAFNPTCAQFFDLLPGDVGQPVDRLTHGFSNRDALLTDIRVTVERSIPTMRETSADNGTWFLVHLMPVTNRTGQVEAVAIYFNNISAFKKNLEQKHLLERVFEHSSEALIITDADNRIISINSSFTLLTGYTRQDVLGKSPKILMEGLKSKEIFSAMRKTLRSGNCWKGEIRNKHKDGSVHSTWLTITALRNDQGKIVNFIGAFCEISERKQAELKVQYQAHHDSLTKLLNRFSLDQRLDQSLEQAKRDEHHLAVLFIDLDHFKTINDSLGHHIGDLLLVEVAARLTATVRGSDIVARLGGDEFVVVLPHIHSAIEPAYLADKIQRTLSRPYHLAGHELHNTSSIGISVYPHDGDTVEELLKNADSAMYHAKSKGRNNCQFFLQEMHTVARERLLLEHDLRLAIERNEFILHFHPQIDLASGLVVGVKAMLRWQHPERGIITPDRFLSIADASGLILRIDNLSIEMACRQLAAWTAESLPRIRIAVKLSAKQFRQKTLPDKIAAIVSKTGIDPSLLELEITENTTMENPDETIHQLDQLSKIGLQLAIDNFGAGYSSLGQVKHFPVNRLIIDRSFVKDIETNSGDAAIAAATISMAHSLGRQVTAKGIETENQLVFFSRHGCNIGQGYFFSRPLPADKAAQFIRHTPADIHGLRGRSGLAARSTCYNHPANTLPSQES